MFQLTEEAQVYKEIEEIDPAKHVRLSAKGIADLRKATIQDDTLSKLAKVIRHGWCNLKQNVPLSIRAFWPFRDELVVDNSIIFKGTKVVIPKSMRTLMLQRIHTNHQGPDACVRWAQDVIFLPGMASEIWHLASQCSTCCDLQSKAAEGTSVVTRNSNHTMDYCSSRSFYIYRKIISHHRRLLQRLLGVRCCDGYFQ